MSNLPAVPQDGAMAGLEDFDAAVDAVMPTLRIDHKTTQWEDVLSGQTYAELDVVILGLVKQRVLWPAEVEEGKSGPLCRSLQFTIGNPDPEKFPWKASGFDEGLTELPCEACPLQEWGSHPTRDTPWCSEQHTFIVQQPLGEGYAPALLTVQRSAIKASRTYLTGFFRANTPLYTVRTKISLEGRTRGSVDFAVPKFVQGEPTDQEDWPYFAEQYLNLRDFVQTPRTRFRDAVAVAEPAGDGAAAPAAAPAAAAPAASTDDELPF